jgi:hypothetical protein
MTISLRTRTTSPLSRAACGVRGKPFSTWDGTFWLWAGMSAFHLLSVSAPLDTGGISWILYECNQPEDAKSGFRNVGLSQAQVLLRVIRWLGFLYQSSVCRQYSRTRQLVEICASTRRMSAIFDSRTM